MLTYAIGFVQNVQLACFAIVLVLMAARDRGNRSLRWFAFAYVAGLIGGVIQIAGHLVPEWLSICAVTLAAPMGYACIHSSIVHFVQRGRSTRWIIAALVLGSIPLYLLWSLPAFNAQLQHIDRVATLADLTLAIETTLTSWLLLSTHDRETAWPRRVMGVFLAFYSAVEYSRVAAFLITGQMPDRVAPWIEIASGIVYVVSCSVLPLAFIWMLNSRLHAHMGRQMTTDTLTHLLNRRGLETAGALELARYRRSRSSLAVALADLDYFKSLNDTYGHAGGDLVLSEAAALFRSLVRETDIVGRLGGEEFVLILPEIEISAAIKLVERLRSSLEAHVFQIGSKHCRVTSSFGLTLTSNRNALTWENLVHEADQALYAAKHAGRNRSAIYDVAEAEIRLVSAGEVESSWPIQPGVSLESSQQNLSKSS